jgi:WD40 repeat protein
MGDVLRAMAASRLKSFGLIVAALGLLFTAGHVAANRMSPAAQASGAAVIAQADQQTDTDLLSDPLPARAVARLGTVRFRPGNEVTAVAFSGDGMLLASAPIMRNTIQLWQVATGRCVQELRGHSGTILQVTFSADARFLASGSLDKTIRLWDVRTGEEVGRFATPWPGEFALSPDGKVLAAANVDKTVSLWELTTGQRRGVLATGIEATFPAGFFPIPLAFSPDGKQLATADREILRVWDVRTQRQEYAIEADRLGSPRAAVFVRGGVRVLSSSYGAPNTPLPHTLWAAFPGNAPRILRSEKAVLASFAFSRVGDVVLFTGRGSAPALWDTATGTEIRRYGGLHGDARSVALSSDGKTAAAGTSASTLDLWDTVTGRFRTTAAGHDGALEAVAFRPDGKVVVTAGADATVRLWAAVSGKELWTMPGADTWRLPVGRLLAGWPHVGCRWSGERSVARPSRTGATCGPSPGYGAC